MDREPLGNGVVCYVDGAHSFGVDGILLADFSNWASDKTLNANIFALILILGIMAGALLIAAGIVKNSRKRGKEKD